MSILGRKLTFIFLLVSSLLSPQGYAQLQIVITQGVDNPVQIAIVPFDWNGFGLLEENVTDIVSANLRNSGEFASIAEENMLSTPHEQADVFFRDWRFLGADYLLIGKINDTGAGSALQVQYELFDVLREERIFDEVLSGSRNQLRDVAHTISDNIFEQVTGVKGAFATKILYVTSQRVNEDLSYYQLNLSDADGGRPQVLLNSQEPIMSPNWSPDGEQIAYVSFESTRPRIYIQDLATGTREQITDFPGINSSPVFSPDGTKLAMVLSKDGNPDVYVLDLRTDDLRRITNHFAIDTEPSWTPDSESLIFTSERGGNSRPQLYQVSLETGWVERLTFQGTYNSKGIMLPDGVNLLMVHRESASDEYHLAIQNIDRGTMRILTDTALDESPSVAPNASMVIYASKAGNRGILNAVSIDGRVKFQLPSAQGDVREPAWSPFFD
ncbi:MAG: Tol-Pal system protein TolB [Gammaproteobacteria bacterium]|jgi:TolB protein|nr:Tol-Pal system protein TolB [Gammaproteobacteria bacterium]